MKPATSWVALSTNGYTMNVKEVILVPQVMLNVTVLDSHESAWRGGTWVHTVLINGESHTITDRQLEAFRLMRESWKEAV